MTNAKTGIEGIRTAHVSVARKQTVAAHADLRGIATAVKKAAQCRAPRTGRQMPLSAKELQRSGSEAVAICRVVGQI
jgi:hypothetical protein